MTLFLPALFGVGNAGDARRWRSVGLVVFGLGWGFFDCNNMPILCQIVRPRIAGHRLWHHEPGEHQLRRFRRLGASARCAIATCR